MSEGPGWEGGVVQVPPQVSFYVGGPSTIWGGGGERGGRVNKRHIPFALLQLAFLIIQVSVRSNFEDVSLALLELMRLNFCLAKTPFTFAVICWTLKFD